MQREKSTGGRARELVHLRMVREAANVLDGTCSATAVPSDIAEHARTWFEAWCVKEQALPADTSARIVRDSAFRRI